MTIKDLFDVMWSIKEVTFTARAPETQRLLCIFWIGEGCNRDKMPKGYLSHWTKGEFYFADRKINAHGEPTRGGAEIGWGYKNKSIPDALLNAEITHLTCLNHYHGGYSINADVVLDAMTVEILKEEFRKLEEREINGITS